jgi:hypothetical protein
VFVYLLWNKRQAAEKENHAPIFQVLKTKMAVSRNCVDRALALLRGLPRVSLGNLKDADYRKKVSDIFSIHGSRNNVEISVRKIKIEANTEARPMATAPKAPKPGKTFCLLATKLETHPSS